MELFKRESDKGQISGQLKNLANIAWYKSAILQAEAYFSFSWFTCENEVKSSPRVEKMLRVKVYILHCLELLNDSHLPKDVCSNIGVAGNTATTASGLHDCYAFEKV